MLRKFLVISLILITTFDLYVLRGDLLVKLYCRIKANCIESLVLNNQTARGLAKELNQTYNYIPNRFVIVWHPPSHIFSFLKTHIYGSNSKELVAMTLSDLGIIITTSDQPRILKHELTHLWFHTGIKWLDEGVAEYISLGPAPCVNDNPYKYKESAFYSASWKKVSCLIDSKDQKFIIRLHDYNKGEKK